jgi:hypothetical protein
VGHRLRYRLTGGERDAYRIEESPLTRTGTTLTLETSNPTTEESSVTLWQIRQAQAFAQCAGAVTSLVGRPTTLHGAEDNYKQGRWRR